MAFYQNELWANFGSPKIIHVILSVSQKLKKGEFQPNKTALFTLKTLYLTFFFLNVLHYVQKVLFQQSPLFWYHSQKKAWSKISWMVDIWKTIFHFPAFFRSHSPSHQGRQRHPEVTLRSNRLTSGLVQHWSLVGSDHFHLRHHWNDSFWPR